MGITEQFTEEQREEIRKIVKEELQALLEGDHQVRQALIEIVNEGLGERLRWRGL